jgi:hypothetical protein
MIQALADFDFALTFFFALRSLFFMPTMPALQTSAYRTKKVSSSAGATTVDSFIFGAFAVAFFFVTPEVLSLVRGLGFEVLPSVARTRIEPSAIVGSSEETMRFCVRETLPLDFWEVLERRVVKVEKNCFVEVNLCIHV